MLNNVHHKKNRKIPPLNRNSVLFRFASIFRFILLISVLFRFRFFLDQTIFRFIFVPLRFFRFFLHISHSFSLQILAVSLRCETSEIMLFFASERNKIFPSISILRMELIPSLKLQNAEPVIQFKEPEPLQWRLYRYSSRFE